MGVRNVAVLYLLHLLMFLLSCLNYAASLVFVPFATIMLDFRLLGCAHGHTICLLCTPFKGHSH